jgi:hypothetical protein
MAELNPNIILQGDMSQIYNPNKAQAEQQQLAEGNFNIGLQPLKQKAAEQKVQAGDIELQQAKINDGLQMLQFAKGRPEAWASVRQAAIQRGFPAELVPEQYSDQFVDQAMQSLLSQKSGVPANIQNAKYYSSLDEAGKQAYVDANRATPYLNTGQQFVKPLATGGMTNAIPINPKISEMPEFEGEVEKAKADAKNKAEKEAQMTNAQKTKDAALEVVNRLVKNKSGVAANRGGISRLLPNVSDAAVNAEADLETLASMLTVENLGLLKGVLSDTDMKVLKDVGAGGLKGADDQVINNLAVIKQTLENAVSPSSNSSNQSSAPKAGSTVKWGDL